MQSEPIPESERKASIAYVRWGKGDVINELVASRKENENKRSVTRDVMAKLVRDYTTDPRSLHALRKRKKRHLLRVIAAEYDIRLKQEQSHLTKKQLCQIGAENGVFGDG